MSYQSLIDFLNEEDGANATEYALIASIVSIAIMLAVIGVRGGLSSTLQGICNAVANVAGIGGC